MMLFIFLLFMLTEKDQIAHEQMNDCFSISNFDVVYNYLGQHISSDTAFLKHEDHDVYIKEGVIYIKKNQYTLSSIDREKGILALSKSIKDQQSILSESHRIFCDLLSRAKR